jgi:uncharacterized OsmC-like protein
MSTEVTGERDSPTPIIRRKTLEHGGTGAGPSPLQAVLGALCGCEAVTFARTAAELDFQYDGIDFEAEFKIDIRGRLGNRDVRPHFQIVRVLATVATDASEDELRAVVEETERRCPVFNLVADAGVRCEMRWVRSSA